MRTWEYFKMDVPRSEMVYVYGSEEQDQLHEAVAKQVARLLSTYGDLVTMDFDESEADGVEDIIEYETLEADEIELEDGTFIWVLQMPEDEVGIDVTPGVYRVLHTTDESVPIRDFTVRDISIDDRPLVTYENGDLPDTDVLQELHEALGVLIHFNIENANANVPPYDSRRFPRIDPAYIKSHLFDTVSFSPVLHQDIDVGISSN